MAGRHTQTIDLGDVNIEKVLEDFDRDMASPREISLDTDQPNRGVELNADSEYRTINPARRLNPQRPFDPANLQEPTDLGLPPVVSQLGTNLSELKTRFQEFFVDRRPIVLRIALGLILVGGFGSVMYFMDPDRASEFEVAPDIVKTEPKVPANAQKTPAKPAVPKANTSRETSKTAAASNSLRPIDQQLLDNPYWPLPNRLSVQAESKNRLTAKQRADWEYHLNHRFAYQQYKAIREIRAQRIRSSGYLLVQALDKPKFWMRINGLMGLAEMGIAVDIETVQRAIGNARSALVANFLKRFLEIDPNKAELFVLRQMIRVVDARSRLVILQVLARLRGEVNDLYLVGANYDPSQRIERWRNSQVGRFNITRTVIGRYHSTINSYLGTSSAASVPSDEPVVENLAVEELKERRLVNEVKFFQELIDSEEDAITEPDELQTDGFESLQ